MSSLCHCQFLATIITVKPQQTLGVKIHEVSSVYVCSNNSWSMSLKNCRWANMCLFFILLCLNDYKTHDTWDETWVHYFTVHTKQVGLQYGCWSNTWDTTNSGITNEGNFFSWWLQIQQPESHCNAILKQTKLKSSQQNNRHIPPASAPWKELQYPWQRRLGGFKSPVTVEKRNTVQCVAENQIHSLAVQPSGQTL